VLVVAVGGSRFGNTKLGIGSERNQEKVIRMLCERKISLT
jgi:hypothetical protein